MLSKNFILFGTKKGTRSFSKGTTKKQRTERILFYN